MFEMEGWMMDGWMDEDREKESEKQRVQVDTHTQGWKEGSGEIGQKGTGW